MKTCAYCGAGNEDTASVCRQCGSTFSFGPSRREASPRHLYLDLVSRFRVVLLVGLASYLIYGVGAWVIWRSPSGDIADALGWSGFGAVLILPPVVYWATVALWIAATIGVYFFIPAARLLYTCLVGLTLFSSLIGGMHVSLPVEAFLLTIATLSDGAVLVLAYWSPLRKQFNDPRQPAA